MTPIHDLEHDPEALEARYRAAPDGFAGAVAAALAERPESPVFRVWQARLAADAVAGEDASRAAPRTAEDAWRERRRLVGVAGLVLVAGTLAKLPDLVALAGGVLAEERFYTRNVSFFVLPMLAAYFLRDAARPARLAGTVAALFAASCLYVNLLPDATSDTVTLALLHLPAWLWGLLGLAYVGTPRHAPERRLEFLRYNGEMLVYTALILIAGGLLSGLTIALFGLIGLDIADGYMRTVGVYGLAGAPLVATLLATTRFGVGQRIAPVIARIFGPLALVTLAVYLGVLLTRPRSLFEDREMLAVLNGVLVAVLALIVFSASEHRHPTRFALAVGAGLLGVAIALDLVALSALLTRLAGGATPNRLALLGANGLVLVHLALLLRRYVHLLRETGTVAEVERTLTGYLPLYVAWAAVVTFLFPLLFRFA